MRKQWVKDSEVGMSKSGSFFGKIQQVPDKNVNENPKVVRIKVFLRWRRGEQEIEELQCKELKRRFTWECRRVSTPGFDSFTDMNVLSRLRSNIMFSPNVLYLPPSAERSLMTLLVRTIGDFPDLPGSWAATMNCSLSTN